MKVVTVSRRITMTLAILASWSGSAAAQTRVELFPLLDVTGEYSDNLLFSSVDRKSDELATAVAGASLNLEDARRQLEFDYLTDGQVYVEHSHFDRALQDHYVGLNDHERFGENTELSLNDSFIKGQPIFGQALLGASGVSPQLGQALLQRDFLTNSFSARLHQTFNPAFYGDFTAHQSFYSAGQAGVGESFNQGVGLTGAYRLAPSANALIGYDFEDFRYSSQPRQESHAPSIGIAWDPSSFLKLAAQAGPLILQSPSNVRADVGYSLTAQYQSRFWLASVATSRAPSVSAGFGGTGISESATGSLVRVLDRRTSAFANAGYSRIQAGAASSQILNYAAGIAYKLDREVSLTAQYLGFRSVYPTGPAALTDTFVIGLKISPEPWRTTWQ